MTADIPAPLTLESMRADIAALLNIDPAAIGDTDNLMDLGLDSLRAMNLVLRWEETGVTLDFAELAVAPTLAHWWDCVILRQPSHLPVST